MKKQKKTEQINLRVTNEEKDRIKYLSKKSNLGSLTEYIISRSLNIENDVNTSFKKINTITINPWVLCTLEIGKLKEVNLYETKNLNFDIKGSGINTSRVIKSFNIPTLAIHYSGGFTGKYLLSVLNEQEVEQLQFNSERSAVTNLEIIYEKDKRLTFKSEQLKIFPKDKQAIMRKVKSFSSGEILFLTGDFHDDDRDFIFDVSKIAKQNNIKIVYDLNENFNKLLLKFKPIILKIRYVDLKEIYKDLNLTDDLDNEENRKNLIEIVNELKTEGAENILITFGKKGSLLYDVESNLFTASLAFEFKSSYQGAGDAFIGAFISNYLVNSYEAFLYANAAGLASVSKRDIPTVEEINAMKENVKIKKH